jgi:hypothetical protein
VVKIREGKRVSASLVKWQAQQCGIACPLSITLAQAREHFLDTDLEYRDLKAEAPWLYSTQLID